MFASSFRVNASILPIVIRIGNPKPGGRDSIRPIDEESGLFKSFDIGRPALRLNNFLTSINLAIKQF